MDRHRCIGARLRPAREALGVGVFKTLELRAHRRPSLAFFAAKFFFAAEFSEPIFLLLLPARLLSPRARGGEGWCNLSDESEARVVFWGARTVRVVT